MNKAERYHSDLDAEYVRTILDYNPETGVFTWIAGRADRIGREASSVASRGYRTIAIRQKNYRRGRLAWLYVTGEWPEGEIDHINRVRDDDRWSNLRIATRLQQEWNKSPRESRSGLKGVTFLQRRSPKKWRAMINVDGRHKLLGYFATQEDAGAAYNAAALLLQGEFAYRGDHLAKGSDK